MGVRGLTTYIYNNSSKFFDNFKLSDSDIVIDGNCLASILFFNSITSTSSFGGDYDKYGKAVENFFNQLLKCKISPFVIFDGGYEKKKLFTVYNRNKNKVRSLYNIGPTNHSHVCFPLMMRQAFRDKLREMDIPFAQSDFEADREIAALARKLKCPVLSNDSDFFIFDVTLIPLNEFSLEAVSDGEGKFYIKCLIYKVESFLLSLGGLPKSHLPLLAALLGNDYISTSTFANFYSQMKITRGRKLNQIHHRVQAIMSWLKNESFESALRKILSHLKKYKQKQVARKVARIINDYRQVSTPLDTYLVKKETIYSDIEIISVEYILQQYDSIDDTLETDEVNPELDESYCVSEDYSATDSAINAVDVNTNTCISLDDQVAVKNQKYSLDFKEVSSNPKNIPQWLLEYSRGGNVPACIFTLYTLRTYFCIPQVEEYELCHAGSIGVPILSKIAGILLGDCTYSYYSRTHKIQYACTKVETIIACRNKQFPLVSRLNELNKSQCKTLFYDIFELDSEVLNIVNYFPESWHLFIFSLVYWARNIKEINFQPYYFHSITLMIICIRVVESKIGYFRNKRPFMQRYASKIKKTDNGSLVSLEEVDMINDIVDKIPLDECLTAFEIFLPYFQIEEKLKTNGKFFSRISIHAFSQFQVCVDFAYTLNSLLLAPFDCLPVYNFINSTFFYNFCSNLKKRSNISAYVETLFVKCPTILYLHKKIVEHFSCFIAVSEEPEVCKKRRKKKRKNVEQLVSLEIDSEKDEEVSSYSDDDNAFSLLSKLRI